MNGSKKWNEMAQNNKRNKPTVKELKRTEIIDKLNFTGEWNTTKENKKLNEKKNETKTTWKEKYARSIYHVIIEHWTKHIHKENICSSFEFHIWQSDSSCGHSSVCSSHPTNISTHVNDVAKKL